MGGENWLYLDSEREEGTPYESALGRRPTLLSAYGFIKTGLVSILDGREWSLSPYGLTRAGLVGIGLVDRPRSSTLVSCVSPCERPVGDEFCVWLTGACDDD